MQKGIFATTILAILILLHINKPLRTMTTLSSLAQTPPNWQLIRLLTANVGNISLACRGPYNHKLCEKSVEENISKYIQILQPDIVFFQELLHPSQCDGWIEANEEKACFENLSEPNQTRRLLGNSYTILCASRMRQEIGHPVGMECIGVHLKAGTIEGCLPGELCYTDKGLDTPTAECNPEFIIMSVNATIRNIPMRLINAHPHSQDKQCRDNSLEQLFESISDVSGTKANIIIAGDFNFDPFRSAKNTPSAWGRNVGTFGSGKPFYYHSGIAEHNPPYPTAHFLLQKKTIDHVISNFAAGVCATLGESPGTQRIDGGKGMDHRAILCEMWIPPHVSGL
jgi:endonuclease/exonuclease/phosphatase family metal-dependent hydrolase